MAIAIAPQDTFTQATYRRQTQVPSFAFFGLALAAGGVAAALEGSGRRCWALAFAGMAPRAAAFGIYARMSERASIESAPRGVSFQHEECISFHNAPSCNDVDEA